jgi:hypothetical protein
LNKTTNQKRLTKKKKTYQVDEVDPFYWKNIYTEIQTERRRANTENINY